MDKMSISYQNYDFTIKKALKIFQEKTLDFLDVSLPKIKSSLNTEFKEIVTKTDLMDLNFLLEDGSILQLEEEVDISQKDMVRFAYYNLALYKEYKTDIKTIILTIDEAQKENLTINTGSVKFTPKIINFGKKDGDKKLKEIRELISEGKEINELELVFLPIMKTQESRINFLKKIILTEKELKINDKEKENLIAMTLVAGNKLVQKEEIEEIWEEIKMLAFMEYAEEKGIKKGMEQGMERGMEKGIEKGMGKTLIRQLTKKIGKLPDDYREAILNSKEEVLDVISEEIFDIEKLSDIDRYLDIK